MGKKNQLVTLGLPPLNVIQTLSVLYNSKKEEIVSVRLENVSQKFILKYVIPFTTFQDSLTTLIQILEQQKNIPRWTLVTSFKNPITGCVNESSKPVESEFEDGLSKLYQSIKIGYKEGNDLAEHLINSKAPFDLSEQIARIPTIINAFRCLTTPCSGCMGESKQSDSSPKPTESESAPKEKPRRRKEDPESPFLEPTCRIIKSILSKYLDSNIVDVFIMIFASRFAESLEKYFRDNQIVGISVIEAFGRVLDGRLMKISKEERDVPTIMTIISDIFKCSAYQDGPSEEVIADLAKNLATTDEVVGKEAPQPEKEKEIPQSKKKEEAPEKKEDSCHPYSLGTTGQLVSVFIPAIFQAIPIIVEASRKKQAKKETESSEGK